MLNATWSRALFLGVAILVGGVTIAETPQRPAKDFADLYGYAPGREFPEDLGWVAHTGGGSGYPFTHSTEYETFPDFFRVTIGWGSRYHRSFMKDLQGYPGVSRPGRIVLRARRDTTGGEIKFFLVNDDSQWGIRVAGGEIKPFIGEPVKWASENWTTWHNYIIDNTGDKVTFSIDEDPKLTVVMEKGGSEGKNPGQAYISIGHSWVEENMRWYDVQSLHFLEPGQPIPAPAEVSSMNGEYASKYPGGQTRTQGTYVNGTPVGDFVSYFANGQKESEGTFDAQGRKQGTWTYWYSNGQKRKELGFADDLYHGPFHRWPIPAELIDPADTKHAKVVEAMAEPKGYTRVFEHGQMPAGAQRTEWTSEPKPAESGQ